MNILLVSVLRMQGTAPFCLSFIQQTPSTVLLFLRLCYRATKAEAMKGSPSRAMSWLGDRQITDNGKDIAKEKGNKCNKLKREGGPLSLMVNKGFLNWSSKDQEGTWHAAVSEINLPLQTGSTNVQCRKYRACPQNGKKASITEMHLYLLGVHGSYCVLGLEVMDVNECAWKIMNIGTVMRM